MKFTSIFAKPFLFETCKRKIKFLLVKHYLICNNCTKEFKMKKRFLSFVCAAFAALLVCSCASISEPTGKNNNLVYGNISFDFKCFPNNYGFPETYSDKNGIEVVVQNMNTDKTYILTSKSNGEISKTGLPDGIYRIKRIKKEQKMEFGYSVDIDLSRDDIPLLNTFQFSPVEDSAVNLGSLKLQINVKDIDPDKFTYNYELSIINNYEQTYNIFADAHADSSWQECDWFTPQESLKR